ncbi:MAG: 2-oxo acid dehydrogenase subunit E2 [Gammaproteobacteria bacterium]
MTDQPRNLLLPSMGEDDMQAEVIELPLAPGTPFAKGDVLVIIESDKATLEVPAPDDGSIVALKVQVGSTVQKDSLLLEYQASTASQATPTSTPQRNDSQPDSAPASTSPPASPASTPAPAPAAAPHPASQPARTSGPVYAGPAVRRLARQLGIDLTQVSGTGNRSRIQLEDLHLWVRTTLQKGAAAAPALPATEWPDLSQYGAIKEIPLSRIQKVSARRLHASWVNIPHVCQHDQAEISAMEQLRAQINKANQASQAKQHEQKARLTPLPFLIKACVAALTEFPLFRSALTPDGTTRIERDSYHIGIAVDTEKGLLVPTIRDADQRNLHELATEAAQLAQQARDGKLSPAQMAGAVFTISSLGHLGGTGFTPIINPPQVAILGVSKIQERLAPAKNSTSETSFRVERLLPLSLSYDHRLINGVDAVRFTRAICQALEQPETLAIDPTG